MKRFFLSMTLAALAIPSLACGGSGNTGDTGSSSGDPVPFRDDWRTVIDQPFTVDIDPDTPNIRSIEIGNEGGDNFRNRGDVIVQYHDSPRIIVEMRKFTQVENQSLADEDFDKLSIFATTSTLPPPPFTLDEEDNCVDTSGEMNWQARKEWQDGCQIVVFYDGQQQVDRSGADIRVTLPREFIYDLTVTTEDNDADSDYQNRGNVCIEGLPGSADISLSNGTAWVILDESMNEMPECDAESRNTCVEAGWNPTECPCLAQAIAFSQVKITSNDGQSSDGVVDIPPGGDFWVGYNLRNDGQNTPGNEEPGGLCEAVADASAGEVRLSENTNLDQSPNNNQGSINFPGEPATPGAGYNIQMTSDQCAVVLATEDPDNFVGVGNGPEQDAEERGNFTICSGCARSVGCSGLVPGL
ncbi:MAG: hypothetical protein ACE37F_17115 [Nannocystaceae bacterium]|nr:hypothetical protein [bacterium]